MERLTLWRRPKHEIRTIYGVISWLEWLNGELLRVSWAGRKAEIRRRVVHRQKEFALYAEDRNGQ